jgi:protein gp37
MAANYPFGFEPAFYEYRLEAPKNTRIPVDSNNPADGRVFVGSMADVFGKWVPDEWIQKIFDACMEAPGWEYLFLTKWPNRYKMLESLPKAWFGASVIQQSDVARVEREMKSFETTGIKWISLEPMLEQITFNDLSWCNLVVIGAQTATQQPSGYVPEKAADFEWVWDVVRQCKDAGVPYYLKPNLLQSPGMILPKGEPS